MANIYLKPKDFQEEYTKCKEVGKCSNKLLLMFEKIAKKYVVTFGGKNKLDNDACVNYALTEAWKKWEKYDETKSTNIFAFFTQMIKNDLMAHHNKLYHKKELYVSLDSVFSNNQNN